MAKKRKEGQTCSSNFVIFLSDLKMAFYEICFKIMFFLLFGRNFYHIFQYLKNSLKYFDMKCLKFFTSVKNLTKKILKINNSDLTYLFIIGNTNLVV